MADYKIEPLKWYQPASNPIENFALRGAAEQERLAKAPWYEKAINFAASPFSTMVGGLLADQSFNRSFDQIEQNEALKDEYRAKGIPIRTDMYGNVVPVGGSAGTVASFFRGLGAGNNSGLLGALGSSGGGGTASPYYGGYVVDSMGNPIKSGSGYVTYGSGPNLNEGAGAGQAQMDRALGGPSDFYG